jgi:hypothetical protein
LDLRLLFLLSFLFPQLDVGLKLSRRPGLLHLLPLLHLVCPFPVFFGLFKEILIDSLNQTLVSVSLGEVEGLRLGVGAIHLLSGFKQVQLFSVQFAEIGDGFSWLGIGAPTVLLLQLFVLLLPVLLEVIEILHGFGKLRLFPQPLLVVLSRLLLFFVFAFAQLLRFVSCLRHWLCLEVSLPVVSFLLSYRRR